MQKNAVSTPAPTLAETLLHYGRQAYLLTVGKDGPHTSQVTVGLAGRIVGCSIGPSASRNIAGEPKVSLFWPSREPGGYALIMNGLAAITRAPDGSVMAEITLTKSVLHRSGPRTADSDGPCASDCKRISLPG